MPDEMTSTGRADEAGLIDGIGPGRDYQLGHRLSSALLVERLDDAYRASEKSPDLQGSGWRPAATAVVSSLGLRRLIAGR
jgi:hypothetical protein